MCTQSVQLHLQLYRISFFSIYTGSTGTFVATCLESWGYGDPVCENILGRKWDYWDGGLR